MKQRLKDIALVLAFILPGLLIMYFDISRVKEPVNVEYFKAGDVLLPDYAVIDTLIVVDAVQLNKDMALIEQGIIEATDGEIAAVFYKSCKVY